ncbi:MAG: hypothetical protein JNM31_05080 [Flavobacteriales bacterium]|nr:hypothetical protein [Flavobacteriales bacterium]
MRVVVFLLALTGMITAHAQRNLEVGLSTGVTHYYGDLGNWDGPMQWNSIRPGMAVTFRDFLNNPNRYVTRALTVEGRLSWHRIGYDETEPTGGMSGRELRNFGRGLNFRTDLFGASGHLVLNAYREPYKPLFEQRFFMYFFVGVGVFYGRPKGDLFRGSQEMDNMYHYWSDGTIRDMAQDNPNAGGAQVVERDGTYETDLYNWRTEGGWVTPEGNVMKGPSPWHIGFPWGLGVRYLVTKQISVGAEFCYYSFLSDKLDDVSERYATWDEISRAFPGDTARQQMARYISDPSGWGTDGTTNPTITSQRGNPALPDYFSYLSFEVSYKFKRKPSQRLLISRRD